MAHHRSGSASRLLLGAVLTLVLAVGGASTGAFGAAADERVPDAGVPVARESDAELAPAIAPLVILNEVIVPAAITSPPFAEATVGTAYSFQLTSNVAPVTYSVSGLPAGLRASARTGLVSGTPTEAGTFAVRLQALGEETGDTSFVVFQTLVVNAVPVVVPVITSPPLPAGTVGRPYSFRVTSDVPSARFSITGLPPGLAADPATGVITGTPRKAGTSTVRLAALPATPGDSTFVTFDNLVITPAAGVAGPITPPGG